MLTSSKKGVRPGSRGTYAKGTERGPYWTRTSDLLCVIQADARRNVTSSNTLRASAGRRAALALIGARTFQNLARHMQSRHPEYATSEEGGES